jgi:hypothetical protein
VLFGFFSGLGKELGSSEGGDSREPDRCLTVRLSCSNSLWISAILLDGISHFASLLGTHALLFTRRKEGSMMHGPLPRCAHREQGSGYCSVALHRAFIWRQRVHERAPRTERGSIAGLVSRTVGGDIFLSSRSIAIVGRAGRVADGEGGREDAAIEMRNRWGATW